MTEFGATNGDTPGGDYALVYPFIVCKSNGGPYDDVAFVAGARFGEIDRDLHLAAMLCHDHTATVEPALVPQLELLAMHRGYTLRTEPFEAPGISPADWVLVTFELFARDSDGKEA